MNAVLACPGECWTAKVSEFHSGAVASSLSDILEDDGSVPQQFFLTPEGVAKMFARLKQYGVKPPAPEVLEAFGLWSPDGQEIQPLSSRSEPRRPSVRAKEAK